MPIITTHRGNALNDALTIETVGSPQAGNAHAMYNIMSNDDEVCLDIKFHTGNPAEGINGISNEALLAIVAYRLESFQGGPYACSENGWAYTYVRHAMLCLQSRSAQRQSRGVEGTQQV